MAPQTSQSLLGVTILIVVLQRTDEGTDWVDLNRPPDRHFSSIGTDCVALLDKASAQCGQGFEQSTRLTLSLLLGSGA